MNHILRSLPLIFLTTAAAAHDRAHLHQHLNDPNWMPLAAGLLLIGLATLFVWSRK